MACIHGGKQYQVVGLDFKNLDRYENVVAADVLDAWYSPSQKVLDEITQYSDKLPWSIRTSPPDGCNGLIAEIANFYRIDPKYILLGSGTSDLIFRIFPRLVSPKGIIVVKPVYGEYEHVAKLSGIPVYSFYTDNNDFNLDLDRLLDLVGKVKPSAILFINPSNPTGRSLSKSTLTNLLDKIPRETQFIIDETYSEYTALKGSPRSSTSLMEYIERTDRVSIFKSLSKTFALSGLRIGFVASRKALFLQQWTPPYVVGTLAQRLGIAALKDYQYIEDRLLQTKLIKDKFQDRLLQKFSQLKVYNSDINCLVLDVGSINISAQSLIDKLACKDIYIRGIDSQGIERKDRFVRISILSEDSMNKILSEFEKIVRNHEI